MSLPTGPSSTIPSQVPPSVLIPETNRVIVPERPIPHVDNAKTSPLHYVIATALVDRDRRAAIGSVEEPLYIAAILKQNLDTVIRPECA